MVTDKKIYVVMPAYGEAKVIRKVLEDIKKEGFHNIIVVDDGSPDNTYEEAMRVEGVICLSHSLNRGKGAATVTAMEAAKEMDADVILTMDADGQHDPKDIKKMIEPILSSKADIVLSYRNFKKGEVPVYKIVLNQIGNFVVWLFFGLWVKDSQSGVRAYSKKATQMINTLGDDYEFDSEVIREIHRHKLKYVYVPIKVFYTEHSKNKIKRQSIIGGFKTAWKIIWRTLS